MISRIAGKLIARTVGAYGVAGTGSINQKDAGTFKKGLPRDKKNFVARRRNDQGKGWDNTSKRDN